MKKAAGVCDNPDDYVAALRGWRGKMVGALRDAVRGEKLLDEHIKWGHLVYAANGPVLLIRAEANRVLFGFWRGQRLQDLEPRLKPSGNYEMAAVHLYEGDKLSKAQARRMASAAVALNARMGDPRHDAKSARTGKAAPKGKT